METADGKRGLRYKQTFSKNMSKKGEPQARAGAARTPARPPAARWQGPGPGAARETVHRSAQLRAPWRSPPPQITDCGPNDNWTCITFFPDFERFNMEGLEEDTVQLMHKRVYDMAGVLGKTVKVGCAACGAWRGGPSHACRLPLPACQRVLTPPRGGGAGLPQRPAPEDQDLPGVR